MELEEEEEIAEFVFAAAFDVDDVNTELLDEELSYKYNYMYMSNIQTYEYLP